VEEERGRKLFKRLRTNKLLVIIIIAISASYYLLTTQMAGYHYVKFTSTQMEIIPKNVNWDNRTIIQDKEQVNDVLAVISESKPYNGSSLVCEIEDRDMRLLIRRNFTDNVLSWMVCEGEEATYLLPQLVEKRDEIVYETDTKLMSVLEELFER
jgi:hypothetical protein